MLPISTVTKKILEKLIYESFYRFGEVTTSSLLDSLKLFGFFHATNAGISISIEDLKTSEDKIDVLSETHYQIAEANKKWQQGKISEIERFQSIIQSWSIATESLKNRMVDYYEAYDPVNNLFIMAFSGARGSMSQVRQLIGMRGLMSDPQGKIINLPIQTNFREGLTSIDYLISSYGARKGTVDTALKTADSGYLTRRLIYVAQGIIIRELDCQTSSGITINYLENKNFNNLLGRKVLFFDLINPSFQEKKNAKLLCGQCLDFKSLELLKKIGFRSLIVCSPLTCNSSHSVCQTCYGWDLSTTKTVDLGVAVGIIAAQSIGEPGTQLTMRTFHTGGIFTGSVLNQQRAPHSGKLLFPETLYPWFMTIRTIEGKKVFEILRQTTVLIQTWTGKIEEINFSKGSFLSFSSSRFVKKGEVLADLPTESIAEPETNIKPVYAPVEGEVIYEKLFIQNIPKNERSSLRVSMNDALIWIRTSKLITVTPETLTKFPKKFVNKKSFAHLQISVPWEGYFFHNSNEGTFSIFNVDKEFKFYYEKPFFYEKNTHYKLKFCPFAKNYQYLDSYTTIGRYNLFSKIEGTVYVIRKQEFLTKNFYYILDEENVWKVNLDDASFENLELSTTMSLKIGDFVTSTKKLTSSGLILKKDGLRFILQKAIPVFLTNGSIVKIINGEFLKKDQIIANLLSYTQQTQDIVQGLPKIERLFEASKPENKAILAYSAGIVLPYSFNQVPIKYQWEFQEKDFLKFYKQKTDYLCEPIHLTVEAGSLKFAQKLHTPFELDTEPPEQSPKQTKLAPAENSQITTKNNALYCLSSLKTQDFCIFSSIERNENTYQQFLIDPSIWVAVPIPTISDFPSFMYKPYQPKNCITEKWSLQVRNQKRLSKDQKVLRNSQLGINQNAEYKAEYKFPELRLSGRKKRKRWYESYFPFITTENFAFVHYDFCSGKEQGALDIQDLEGYATMRNEWLIRLKDYKPYYLIPYTPILDYSIPKTQEILVNISEFIQIGQPLTEGSINPHELLSIFYSYHSELHGIVKGCLRAITQIQLILLNSIQGIYESQNVEIDNRHLEVILRQMTSKVLIQEGGETPFIYGEQISLPIIMEVCASLKLVRETSSNRLSFESPNNLIITLPSFEPILLSSSSFSLSTESFLSSAGFQETRNVLMKAALEGNIDWFQGLKENIIIGRLIPAGISFLNYKEKLDHFYIFTKKYKIKQKKNKKQKT